MVSVDVTVAGTRTQGATTVGMIVRPRITLAEALSDLVTTLNETSVGSQTSQQAPYDQEYESNEDSFGDGERRDDDDRYSNRGLEYDYAGEDERGH
ncbi:hypothetical protein PHMEG_00040561, partial [Phytophthora megakarya]